MDSKEIVFNTLKDTGNALRVGDIVKLSCLDKNHVEKAMKELKKEEKIFSPARCFWQVK